MSHQNMSCWPVVCAWRVCRLSQIIHRTAHGPTRRTTSRHAIYACGVGSNTPSPELLCRDATRVHIILTNLRERRCPVSRTLLLVTIPLNHHLGLFSFTSTKGRPIGVRAHHQHTSRSTRLAFTSVARCPPWSSCKRKTGCPSNIWLDCLLQSVCCLTASLALSSRWPGALTLACPSDYRLRKGSILPDGGARPARSFSPCPN